jgi:hypothetical protein
LPEIVICRAIRRVLLFPCFPNVVCSFYDPEIPLSCREQMTELCFRCFCEWLQRAPQGIRWWPDIENSEFLFKYVAELPDLRRYLKLLLFLYKLLTIHDGALALKRIGTHPVENILGLIRMRHKWNHNYIAFLPVLSHGIIMATILIATRMSSPVRRDHLIAGSKIVLTTRDDRMYIDVMSVLGWLRHITRFHIQEARQAGDEKIWEQIFRELSPTSSSFIHLVEGLIQSGQQVEPVLLLPVPIANQTILSRIFAFSPESVHTGSICSPSKKRKA